MKNLKTILFGLFVIIGATKSQASYENSLEIEQSQNMPNQILNEMYQDQDFDIASNNDAVEVQALSDENDNEEIDTNVEIQGIGQSQNNFQLTPEEKTALKAKILARIEKNQEVQTQSINDDEANVVYENNLESDNLESDNDVQTQSINDNPNDDFYEDNLEADTIEIQMADFDENDEYDNEDDFSNEYDDVRVQSLEEPQAYEEAVKRENEVQHALDSPTVQIDHTESPVASIENADEHTPELASLNQPEIAATVNIPARTEEEVQVAVHKIEEAPAVHVVSELAQAVKASSDLVQATAKPAHADTLPTVPSAEQKPFVQEQQVKIVKVYPVYEAISSAMKNIKVAAQDMLQHAYSWIMNK